MTKCMFIAACVVGLMTGASTAQNQPPPARLPADVANVPETIKNLSWQSIDLETVSPLEYARALMLMNHVLDEVGPVCASEADLMSGYIEARQLGGEFAGSPPPPRAKQLTYTDVTKIAVAMLRGPMADSSYSRQLANLSDDSLAAYRHMYDNTCQRRWSEVNESRQQTRLMGTFLQRAGRMQDYQAWAKLESENRELKYQLAMQKQAAETAAAQSAQASAAHAQQVRQLNEENHQLTKALSVAQTQQQQANAAAQQQAAQPAQDQAIQAGQPQAGGYAGPYYGGYGVPPYYGAGAAWCYDAAYANEARAQTEQRLSSYYGAGRPGGYSRPAGGRR